MHKAISTGCLAVVLLTMLGCESKVQPPAQGSGRDLWTGIYTD